MTHKLPDRLKHLQRIVDESTTKHRWVYIIQCGEFIKIGIAEDVSKRLATLQTGSPHKLTLLRKFKSSNAERVEQELHEKLGKHHHRNEWFRLDDVVKAWVESI